MLKFWNEGVKSCWLDGIGMSVSLLFRKNGVSASQLLQYSKVYTQEFGVAVGVNETAVPASALHEAMKKIKQLKAALGRSHFYKGRQAAFAVILLKNSINLLPG